MNDQEHFDWIEKKWNEQVSVRGLPSNLEYPHGEVPITRCLELGARTHPNRPAVNFYGREVSYRELDEWCNRFARFLIDNGYGRGDYIAIHLYNCPQYLVAHFGGMKAGCTIVPLDPVWKEIELETPIEDVGPSLIVSQDVNFPVIQKLKDRFEFQTILTTAFRDFLPQDRAFPFPEDLDLPKAECPGALDFMTVLEGCPPEPPEVELKLEDSASLDYTGGTTGRSKGCLHDHRGIIYTRACMHTYLGMKDLSGKAYVQFVPAFHTAGRGLIEGSIMSGMTCVLLTRFDPVALAVAIPTCKASLMWAPSDLYEGIAKLPEEQLAGLDFTSMEILTCTQYNVPINESLREKWAEISKGGVLVDVTYGLTETLSMNTFTYGLQDVDLKKQAEKGGVFVGLPMPGTQIKFVDLVDAKTLPPNEVGQLAIKDPALSPEYFKREQETRNLYLEDGFLLTGDLGMFDEDGFVYYKGRTKEIIKVSGYTVSPREIELIIGRHQDVRSVAVVGAPDARQGEIPVAFVVLHPQAVDRTGPDELRQWFQDKMSGYKVPKHVVLKPELPMLLGLKVDRRKLQQEALERTKQTRLEA
jgi:acyl-CoA synthetase (AMP-forming)/AMP-acid ligase II